MADAEEPITHVEVAIDLHGDALVVCSMTPRGQSHPGIYSVRSHHTDWTAEPDLVELLPDRDLVRPRLGMNGSGRAFAVWEVEDHVDRYQLRGGWFDRDQGGSGWTWVAPLDHTPFDGLATEPAVAVTEDGHAIVLWRRHDDTTSSIQAIRFASGDTVPTPEDLSDGLTGTAHDPRVAVFPNGVALVVWVQHTDVFDESLMMMRYVPGEGWRDR
ncbi:MAG: hypothetical protein GY704_10515, partial [Phycisphaeraceae bacterium]|nr:hypothetical protein [Phycisphaeraceae bacterium]